MTKTIRTIFASVWSTASWDIWAAVPVSPGGVAKAQETDAVPGGVFGLYLRSREPRRGRADPAGVDQHPAAVTPLAAAGLAPIAGGAAVFHLTQREVPPLVVTLTLLALAVFMAYARWLVLPL